MLYLLSRAFMVAQMIKNLPAMQETEVWSLGWEDLLEKRKWLSPPVFLPGEIHGHSAWSHRVRHYWVTNTFTLSTVWSTVSSVHLFLVHSDILQIPFQNSQSLWSLPQSSSFLLPTRTNSSLWFHSTFHDPLLLYMETELCYWIWFIIQGRDLLFIYVPGV